MPVKIHLKVLMFAGYWRTETESVEAKEVDLQLLVQQVVDVEDLMGGDLEKKTKDLSFNLSIAFTATKRRLKELLSDGVKSKTVPKEPTQLRARQDDPFSLQIWH